MSEKWISLEAYHRQGQVTYYGPGLYWLPLPDWFTIENTEDFKREIFRFAIDLAKKQNQP